MQGINRMTYIMDNNVRNHLTGVNHSPDLRQIFIPMQKSILSILVCCGMLACQSPQPQGTEPAADAAAGLTGQSGVKDEISNPTVVQIASGSADHTTLVTAIKAAELVDVLSNTGPFTVFAPTNAAFEKLPAGTVEGLLKPDQKSALANILEYHVYVGVIKTDMMRDGQVLNQVNLKNITLSVKDGKVMVNGKANIVASIPASNGIIHVIDEVLLPE
jgi:uncharacterized surface protein with fasciclin (FAS1) repeats